ncbi:uncharacterized protein LOC109992043 [Xyrichtys novacula]|uniref:Uncharacterized protein LOC109992043 n=1 Tax=Xyrichtys novacula TaxID=13765 RepID=A0AAV1FQP0_XYRNO|nr:uncharacterized protein LOC109992043 [Xyrichtys novacula]
MSVTMTKTEGVTVLTLTSDPESALPPLCQILKGLCYSPVCCSVSQHLKKVQGSSQSVLGTVQIMVGLLTVGFGAVLYSTYSSPWWYLDSTMYHFWLGGLYMFFGTMCILSEKCPSPCLVILNVILNLAGTVFAVTGIVLYFLNIFLLRTPSCDYDYYYHPVSPPRQDSVTQECLEGQKLSLMLLRSINSLLIILSALELCVTISSAVLGVKALKNKKTRGDKTPDDREGYKPLLEEVTNNPTV